MSDEHIIEMLESKPLAGLSERDLSIVRSHTRVCSACESAYQAALLSTSLIKDRVRAKIEPPPFFQTKVLAALRERQAVENVPAWVRLWKMAGALVSSMAVTTAALAALSFVMPTSSSPGNEQTAAASAEAIIFDQANDDPLSYEQVLSTIYAEEDEAR
jgi:hypothetical protein